jgi:branched-chain amino acid transport system permease protein
VTPYIISGLVVGSIYAISALGLVLTYTSSRVFNFAHGAIAYGIAIFYAYLTQENGWSIEAAAPFTILVVAPLLGLLLYFALFRRLTHSTPTVRLVSTVGLWVAIPALVKILFPFAGQEVFDAPGLVSQPADPNFLKVFGTYLNTNQFVVIASAVVIAVGATLVLRLTPIGLATRATVDHPRNASIAGINTEAVTAGSWMVGVMLAGFAGVLLGPIVGLAEFQFTLLLVGSFAAVVIGRMTSLPLAFLGALGVGLVQQIWVKYQPDEGFLSTGVSAALPFVIMLVFLIGYSFTATGLRREAFEIDRRSAGGAHGDAPPLPPAHGWRRAAGPLATAVVLAALPLLFDDFWIFEQFWIGVFAQGMALAIIFLSFTMVTGEGGLISLCQITLAGIGAFGAARLATEAGWPVWLAILAGAVIAVPFGLLVALPSLRIGDLYLALLTLGFALLVEQLVWIRPEYDNFGAGIILERPFGLAVGDRIEMYAIVAIVFGVLALLIVNLKRATSGLVFASIRSSEPASMTTGISIVRTKLILFAASAFVAGLGGALYASTVGSATPRSFNALIGIVWLAIVVTWGVRSVVGALLAGMIYAIVPSRLSVILILVLIVVLGGLIAQLVTTKAYRTPRGAVAIVLLAAAALAGSAWMWDNVTEHDAVSVILVLIAVAAGALVGLRVWRTPAGVGAKAVLLVVVAALTVWAAVALAGLDLGDSAAQVPTMLFGLGAIGLASEPRGVIHDIVNRQRLRRFKDAERREEEERLRVETASLAPGSRSDTEPAVTS